MIGTLEIVAVTPFAVVGGAERWLLDVIERAPRGARYRVVVLAEGALVDELRRLGVPVAVLPTTSRPTSIARRIGSLVRLLRRDRPHVVLMNGVKAAAVVVPAAFLARVPTVWMKHDHSFDEVLARPLGRAASRVVGVSTSVLEATRQERATVLPPPRPPPAETAESATRFWRARGVPFGSARTLAMVARLVPVKGIEDAIRALPLAPGWRLIVVGGDAPSAPGERDRLLRLAASLGVADRVELIGEVAGAGQRLAAFDAVAVLTRADEGGFGREGFGLVALEAALAEVPLIGVGSSPVVRQLAERHGCVVHDRDPSAVAAALRSIERGELATPSGDVDVDIELLDAAAISERLTGILREAASDHRGQRGWKRLQVRLRR